MWAFVKIRARFGLLVIKDQFFSYDFFKFRYTWVVGGDEHQFEMILTSKT